MSSARNRDVRLLSWQGRLGDIGLGVAVVAVVAMMIVPLAPWLVDLLISLNIAFSLVILSASLFISEPLRLTSFPTLLLVATLYRLALNVSTTRLILLRADAGRIIDGFGGYIVGGDILVGAVIFGILAMVMFLVITKGAERVAEVAARFSLDALPGLQMAIDSDLRSGGISALEAGRKRAELDQKSRYYGALDGAMKFVRGDAIACLVITGVNIAGGLAVGMIRRGMSAPQAIDTYGRLTVGDGLVTMIPALLISTAAGFLVTRVSSADTRGRLGENVARQLALEPRAMGAASILLFMLAAVRGLPAWPFVLLGAPLGVGAAVQYLRERRQKLADSAPEEEWRDKEPSAAVEMGESLFAELLPAVQKMGSWDDMARSLAEGPRRDLGIPIARVPLSLNSEIDPRELRLTVKGMPSHAAGIPENEAGLESVMRKIERWLKQRAGRLIGLDDVQAMVHRVAEQRPVLVREAVPKCMNLPSLTELLRSLLSEGISLAHLAEVLEIAVRLPKELDFDSLVERVREGLSPVITAKLRKDPSAALPALMLSADEESALESAIVKTESGKKILLSAEDESMVVQALKRASDRTPAPVLLVSAHLRRPLSRMLSVGLPTLPVVKASEIEPDVPIDVLERVDI